MACSLIPFALIHQRFSSTISIFVFIHLTRPHHHRTGSLIGTQLNSEPPESIVCSRRGNRIKLLSVCIGRRRDVNNAQRWQEIYEWATIVRWSKATHTVMYEEMCSDYRILTRPIQSRPSEKSNKHSSANWLGWSFLSNSRNILIAKFIWCQFLKVLPLTLPCLSVLLFL